MNETSEINLTWKTGKLVFIVSSPLSASQPRLNNLDYTTTLNEVEKLTARVSTNEALK